MDLIDKELVKINFIVKQFSDERDSLIKITETITDKLKKVIVELAPFYSLVSSNSVRQLNRYSFSPRVKETDSLEEKMVRGNLFNKEFEIADDFNPQDGQLIKTVKKDLLKLDDLIGIKILADLNTDCVKMLELINSPEFKEKAIAQNIELCKDDLAAQPQVMRNGLNIYKIKGTYNNYSFELQIKSKIISAWGDMEHAIFYKDYSISPIRDTTQSSMNHVGKLLYDIDDFLESIRSANKDYLKNAQALSFLQWFDIKYTERINGKLGKIGYRVDGIAELLYAIYGHLTIGDEAASKDLRFAHFELTPANSLIEKYVNLRNTIYDLKILESITLSWLYESDYDITAENIDEVLLSYLNLIKVASAQFLCELHQGYDIDEIITLLNSYQTIGFKYVPNESFLLNLNGLNAFMEARSYLNDIADSIVEENRINVIIQTVFIEIYKGSVHRFISETLDDDQIEKLHPDLILIRDKIDNRAKKLKIKISEVLQRIINRS
nr:hypothetical protein [uncultured Mucilaginibacter sp.]